MGILPKKSLAIGADRVPAFPAIEAEPAVAKFGKLLPPDLLACKHTRQDEVEDCDLVIHAAGSDSKNGNQSRVVSQKSRVKRIFPS